jgi:hypothetical protein
MVGESYGGGLIVGGLIVGGLILEADVDGELAAGEAIVREGIAGVASTPERVARESADVPAKPGSDFRSAGTAVPRPWGSDAFFGTSGAPHIPQKRFASEFSLPQCPQRNRPPQSLYP